jgi:hypothetical protein
MPTATVFSISNELWCDFDGYQSVAELAASRTGLALTPQPDPRALFKARWDRNIERSPDWQHDAS